MKTRTRIWLKCRGNAAWAAFSRLDAESKARVSREAWHRIWSSRFSSITSMAKCEAQSPWLGSNCPHYWVNYCPHNEGVNPHYGVFLGDTFIPLKPLQIAQFAMEEGSENLVRRTSVVSRINTKISSKRKREFNSFNNLLRTSLFLPTVSLRFLLDRSCVTSFTI